MFTLEEYNAAMQAFSQPINPLHDGAEQYAQLLKSILRKMQSMVSKPEDTPFPEEPVNQEVN